VYSPFTWENLENQMVRAIPFGKIQKIWAVILAELQRAKRASEAPWVRKVTHQAEKIWL